MRRVTETAPDFRKYFDVVEGPHDSHNPIGTDKLAVVRDLLVLADGDRVLDVGCGAGYFLHDLASRHGVDATGIDISPYALDRARARGAASPGRVRWELQDLRDREPPSDAYDVVSCLGATMALGDYRAAIGWLARAVRPGGRVAVGEVFRDPASGDYPADSMAGQPLLLPELVELASAAGLDPVGIVQADQDDWDRYQSAQWQTTRRWLAAHLDDPDAPAIEELSGTFRDRYLRVDRPHLRWVVLILVRRTG